MHACLFSVSYSGSWGQACLELTDFIAHAGQLGFRTVMLGGKRPHLSPLDATAERLEKIQAALRSADVSCGCVAAYTNLASGPAGEVPLLEMQIAYVESLCQLASALKCRLVRIFTAYEAGDRDPPTLWRRAQAAIREMCDRAAPHGVTIAIQNHHDLALDTTALLDFLAEIDRPNCKLAFDAWSPALRGENLFEAAKRAAPHTVATTNADYVRIPRWRYRPELVSYERLQPDEVRAVSFGEGFIDYEAFFRGLVEGGYRGLATYEICSPLRGGGTIENLDAGCRAYLDWMQSHRLLEPCV